jgi:hypothetical protein
MTCPCRGELCNGPKTDREIKAFASLTKALTKIQNNRIIKRNALSIVHNSEETSANVAHDSEKVMANGNSDVMNRADVSLDLEKVKTNVENEISENIKISNLKNDTSDTSVQTDKLMPVDMKKENIKESTDNTTEADEVMLSTTPDQIIQKIHETNLNENNTKIKEIMPEAPTMKTEEKSVNHIKPSMAMPTAEALQQNSGVMITTDKPVEQTTTETTYMTTTEKNKKSNNMLPTNATRNTATAVFACTFLMLSCLTVKLII